MLDPRCVLILVPGGICWIFGYCCSAVESIRNVTSCTYIVGGGLGHDLTRVETYLMQWGLTFAASLPNETIRCPSVPLCLNCVVEDSVILMHLVVVWGKIKVWSLVIKYFHDWIIAVWSDPHFLGYVGSGNAEGGWVFFTVLFLLAEKIFSESFGHNKVLLFFPQLSTRIIGNKQKSG